MATSTPIDVPFLPLNQQVPLTSGPVARLTNINNGIARRFNEEAGGTKFRIEKRNGFTQYPTTIRNPATGAVSSATMSNPSLLSTLGPRLLAVASASAFVLSEGAGCFEAQNYACPTQVLRANPTFASGTISKVPDSARIGTRQLEAWMDPTGLWIQILDDNGAVIATPRILAVSTTGVVKVTTDGINFWVVLGDVTAGGFTTWLMDPNGVQLFSAGAAYPVGSYFDITANTNAANSIMLIAKNGAAGWAFYTLNWTGAVIVISAPSIITAFGCDTGRLAFLRNDRNNHQYYVVTIAGAGPYTYTLWHIADNTLTVSAGPFNFVVGAAVAPFNFTGVVAPTGNADSTIALSFFDVAVGPGPFYQRNYTNIYVVTAAGALTAPRVLRSLTVASRPYRFTSISSSLYYLVMYFQSDPTPSSPIVQSSYFVVGLNAPYQVCGRFELATAYVDWQDRAVATYYMQVSSPHVANDGGVHLTLAYRVRTTTERVASASRDGTTLGDDLGTWQNVPTSTIGLKDFVWGPDHGQTVEFANELMLPGAQAHQWTGNTLVEDGLWVIPEILSATPQVGAGTLTLLSTYEYVVWAEYTDDNGNVEKSPVGAPVSRTLNGAQNQVQLVITTVHTTTKSNVRICIARTRIVNGIQTTNHYKITSDLAPVLNDDTVFTVTYLDQVSDANIATNPVCYTDKGFLDRFPAPAFSDGVEANNRVWVIGPDKALWVSGAKTEGDSIWFSPALRVPLPTSEVPKVVRRLGNFLIVICDKTQAYVIALGNLPDNAGNGPLPEPQRLDLNHGCTGFAATVTNGIMFSSSQGGVWLIDGSLNCTFIGKEIQDETDPAMTGVTHVSSITTDKTQRVYVQLDTGRTWVYDQIVKAWFNWSSNVATPTLLTTHKGLFTFIDVAGGVWRQVARSYADVDAVGTRTAIARSFTTSQIRFGIIRGYKRIWNIQIYGEWVEAHTLTVVVTYQPEGSDTAVAATYTITPAEVPYVYELPPKYEEVDWVSMVVTEASAADVAGPSFEGLSFEIGIDNKLGKVPTGRRIQAT